jgi:uncharacterized protein (DUF302 family)
MPENVVSIEVVSKISPRSVGETVTRCVDIISTKSLKLFDVIDQSEEAREAGLDLRETVLVLFGDPRAGTPVMVASPLAALDLPLKVLIWSDGGQTKVSYESPKSLATRHRLEERLASRLDGIDALTDALVAAT